MLLLLLSDLGSGDLKIIPVIISNVHKLVHVIIFCLENWVHLDRSELSIDGLGSGINITSKHLGHFTFLESFLRGILLGTEHGVI